MLKFQVKGRKDGESEPSSHLVLTKPLSEVWLGLVGRLSTQESERFQVKRGLIFLNETIDV